MKNIVLQNDAPIIPNKTLGGILLRTNLSKIQNLIMNLYTRSLSDKQKYHRLSTPFEAKYTFHTLGIEICVDVRNGKIYQLTAHSEYKGFLFDKIYVGMPVAQVMNLDQRFFYSEKYEVILCKGCPGISLDIPEVDPPPESVQTMKISAISVYAHEAFTPQGQNGSW